MGRAAMKRPLSRGTKKSKPPHKLSTTKGERSDIRLTTDAKALIQHAAGIVGVSVTSFVVSHSYEAAKKIIAEHDAILLTAKGQRELFDMIAHAPEPNEALKELLRSPSKESF